ncbi:SDR family NAD(P)-dependent oxidoreductase [Methylobacterium nodulans]|uniref:Short-chain dehydrogenase/reductase SDR n=1 Tax=Methylobacterium nodulans (strain LMG 21967 / CNCM I-2342 / ORS 2060) TaxID=460265 RepID=B8IJB0_METNO|nr:SDR family NAD(P)-dependent oxidoreductase [Methylobacterium nodulans]ACL56125.1 short-chain dehydrogenase/reductase SDR [Methylobacterium nodulans ORS 2060]
MAKRHRSALIVGASRGLGLGLVKALLSRGWDVTATARGPAPDLEGLAPVAPRVERVDIDDDATVMRLRETLVGRSFDVVFIVAGVATDAQVPVPEIDRAVALKVYETNAISPIRAAETLAPLVAPGGLVVLMSSILGSVAANDSGDWESYRASKAALNTLARSFEARHRADPFGVVLMHPGWVRTAMGGPEADIDVATSTEGMAEVLERQLGRKGCVYLDYRGETLPW